MPKKLKSISRKEMRRIWDTAQELAADGPLCSEFLKPDEVYNEDGSIKSMANGWGKVFCSRMEAAGFSATREGVANLLILYLLGELDEKGQPKYNLEDVLTRGVNVQLKQDIRAKLEELMAPGPDGKPDPEKLKQLDAQYLRGLQRANSNVEKEMRKALEEGDISPLMTREMSVLSYLTNHTFTNMRQENHEGSRKTGPIIKGSFFDRIRQKTEGGNPSLQDQILGKGESIDTLAESYSVVTTVISNTIKLNSTIDKDLEGTPGNILTQALTPYIQFYRIRERYLKNKNAPLKQMIGTINPDNQKEEFLQNGNNSIENIDDHLYGQYIEHWVDDLSDAEDWADADNVKRSKYQNLAKPFFTIAQDRLCNFGAMVLAYNGQLFHNMKYDLRLEKSITNKGSKNEKVDADYILKGLTFDPITRQDLLRAAFLTDIVAKPFETKNYLEKLEEWEKSVNDEMNKAADLGLPSGILNEILDKSAKLKKKLKGSVSSLEDLTELEQLTYDLRTALNDDTGSPLRTWAGDRDALMKKYKIPNTGKKDPLGPLRSQILSKAETDPNSLTDQEKEFYTYFRRMQFLGVLSQNNVILQRIQESAAFPKQMMESGARIAPRPETEPLESQAAREDRIAWLGNLAQRMNQLKGHHMSQAWDSLRIALARAQSAALAMPDKEAPTPLQIARLDSCMQRLQDAATRYIRHKLNTDDFDKGTDYDRVKMAKIIESRTLRELQQTAPAMEKQVLQNYTAQKDIHGKAGEKPFMSRESISQALEDIKPLIERLNKSGKSTSFHSKDFTTMMIALLKLQSHQEQMIEQTDELTGKQDEFYYGEVGTIKTACNALHGYLQHKSARNDGSEISAERLEAATQLYSYLTSLYKGAMKDSADRKAVYAAAWDKVKKQQQNQADSAAAQEARIKAEAKNEDMLIMQADTAERILKSYVLEHTHEKKDIGEQDKVTVHRVFNIQPNEEVKTMLSNAMLLLYTKDLYDRACVAVNGPNPDKRMNEIYRMVREGKLTQLMDQIKQNDPAAQYFDECKPTLLSTMSKKEGRYWFNSKIQEMKASGKLVQPKETEKKEAGNQQQKAAGKPEAGNQQKKEPDNRIPNVPKKI